MRTKRNIHLSLLLTGSAAVFVLLMTCGRVNASGPGGKIVFEAGDSATGSFQLFTMNPDGTNKVQITNLPANNFDSLLPSISPDGQRVIFCFGTFDANGNGLSDLYIINIDGTGLVQLTNDGLSCFPHWSPDGTQIAFFSNCCNVPPAQIFTIHPDGSALTQLTNPSNALDSQPSWSPQGNAIVFERDNTTFTASQIVVITANGSGQNLALQSPGSKNFIVTPKERFITKKRAGKGRQTSILNSGFFPRWGPLPQ